MRTLENEFTQLYEAGKYAEAIPLAQKQLEIFEKVFGLDNPAVAILLNNLALSYQATGQYDKAEPLYQRALAIREKDLGPDHPDVAFVLNNLGSLYFDTGKYEKAEPLFLRALAIREKALGPDHPDVAQSLNNLALSYQATGQYAKAEPLFLRALAIHEKALGPDHPDVASSLNNLAELYQLTGQYAKAEPLVERALPIREKALGPDHPDVALSLINLAQLYRNTGQYAKAEPLLERALAIHEKALGPDHPDVADSLNSLAGQYFEAGQYEKAEPLLERALAIREKALGPDHPDVAKSLNNLALSYQNIGQYAKAEPLVGRALAIHEKALGPDHPDVATSLNSLARQYFEAGQYEKAEPLFLRTLAIHEKALGPDHPDVAKSLNNLALSYQATGQYAKAEPLVGRALAIHEKALGPDHPDVATSLNSLAGQYFYARQYARAQPLLERALAIREKALGPGHPDVAGNLNGQAILAVAQRNYLSAASLFQRSLLIQDGMIQNVFSFTTEPEKLQFIRSISESYMAYLSLIHQHGRDQREVVHQGLDVVLRRKGIVFDAQARVQEGLQGRMPESVRKEWGRLSVLRGEYARLLLKKPEHMSPELYRERLTFLQKDIEASEQILASQSVLVAGELKQRNITVEAVAKVVPQNGVLVEFVRIHDFDFVKGTQRESARYLAFVLTSADDVTLVDLGEATKLEKEIQGTLESIHVALNRGDLSSVTHSQQSLTGLYASLWAPLTRALGSADRVVLSPDGLLNLVPFSALRAPDGRFLLEQYHFAYVSSGRELVSRGNSLVPSTKELLLVANPAFDDTISGAANPDTAVRSRDFVGTFSPLPGTAREASEIPPLVAGEDMKKQIMVGAGATERVVKNALSPRILHLATHGFFLEDQKIPMGKDARGVSVVSASASGKHKPVPPPKRYENPLVRSGLAFAGANHATESAEGDDGLLTALEITGMDLYGTELVVLSACETAVGEVQTGEGVFGLRRAFALAGAKNLLMSLWPVDDEITADQMKAFYQYLRKLPPAEALRRAQLETIQKLKARDGRANPALWAPLILQGGHAFRAQ